MAASSACQECSDHLGQTFPHPDSPVEGVDTGCVGPFYFWSLIVAMILFGLGGWFRSPGCAPARG